MDEKEYREELKRLQASFNVSLNALRLTYAKSQAKFSVGDIIQEFDQIIQITKISCCTPTDLPYPLYIGYVLKKNMEPRKDKEIGYIHGDKGVQLIKKYKNEK